MLHGQLHDFLSRALATAAVLVACSLAMPGVGAARADDAQVAVVSPGGEQQALALAALAGSEDVVERAYALRSTTGESELTVTGFSLAAILAAAEADPYGFSYLEVQRPAGGSVLLSRHQALDPGAFEDGAPVVYSTAAGTGFLRPSAGEDDDNAADSFEAPQGLTLVLRKGSPLLVEIETSTVRTHPGQPVAFEAIVERAGAGEQLSYSWYFDDGHSASGANTRHSFTKRGSYDVVVGVTTPGDKAGASAVVTIQVGAPLSGPNRKGGGRDPDANAPDHGAATGTSGGAVPPGSGAAAAASHTAPEATQRRHAPKLRAEGGDPVSGMLLTSARTPAPKPTVSAARAGHLGEDGGGAGIPGVAVGLLATIGLLALGALAESGVAFLPLSRTKSPGGALP